MLFSIALLKLKIYEKNSSSICSNRSSNRIFVFEVHRLLLWYHKIKYTAAFRNIQGR